MELDLGIGRSPPRQARPTPSFNGSGRRRRAIIADEREPMSRTFDAIIVGAGQAGPSLAKDLDAAGMRVAIVERHLVGGTCVNTGCMPTKTLVASAYVAQQARRAGEYGVAVDNVSVDYAKVMARAHKVTADARAKVAGWLDDLERGSFVTGHARLVGPHEIEVDGERLSAPRIFLNVGGRAVIPTVPGADRVPVLTNSSILALDTLPEHLVIVGGSYVGLEFAQMFRRFGARVTVVEKGARLIWRAEAS